MRKQLSLGTDVAPPCYEQDLNVDEQFFLRVAAGATASEILRTLGLPKTAAEVERREQQRERAYLKAASSLAQSAMTSAMTSEALARPSVENMDQAVLGRPHPMRVLREE